MTQNKDPLVSTSLRCLLITAAAVVILIVVGIVGYIVYEAMTSQALVDSFRTVRVDMTASEVEQRLGPPHIILASPEGDYWQYETRAFFTVDGIYTVVIHGGVVVSTHEDPF